MMGYETMAKQNAFSIVLNPLLFFGIHFLLFMSSNCLQMAHSAKIEKKENQKSLILRARNITGYNEKVDVNIKLS